jgi:hypothetical protein
MRAPSMRRPTSHRQPMSVLSCRRPGWERGQWSDSRPSPPGAALTEGRIRYAAITSSLRVDTNTTRGEPGLAARFALPGISFVPTAVPPAQTVCARWHRVLERAGVPLVRSHEARHTTATLMLGLRACIRSSSPRCSVIERRDHLELYSHATAAMHREAVSRFVFVEVVPRKGLEPLQGCPH